MGCWRYCSASCCVSKRDKITERRLQRDEVETDTISKSWRCKDGKSWISKVKSQVFEIHVFSPHSAFLYSGKHPLFTDSIQRIPSNQPHSVEWTILFKKSTELSSLSKRKRQRRNIIKWSQRSNLKPNWRIKLEDYPCSFVSDLETAMWVKAASPSTSCE